MANNKDPNQKQPGEKEPGEFHYNPGNMSGKTIDSCKDDLSSKPTLTGYTAVTRNNLKTAMIDE